MIKAVGRACDIFNLLLAADGAVKLAEIAASVDLSSATAFRLVDTLRVKGLVERDRRGGYRVAARAPKPDPLRIGFAAQTSEFAFSRTVTQSVLEAAQAARLDLVVANNRYSRSIALKNADQFVRAQVDLVVEFQTFAEIAPAVASKYHHAGIPLIAVEIPHPGATYFGADNYRAGLMGGRYLGKWAKANWDGQVEEVILLELVAAGALPQSRLTGTLDGLREVLPQVPLSRVIHLNGNGQFQASLAAVRRHLRSRAPRRTLLGAVNDPSALGALRAFEEAGRAESCAAISHNASEEARAEMRRPDTRLMASVAYFPETYGVGIISLALDILNHKPVPPAIYIRHRLVTPANVGHVYATDACAAPRRASATDAN